jgi:predicted porin
VDLQSALHHNTGKGRGRSTNTLRYDTPISRGGFGLQLFTGFDNSDDGDSSYGGGITYTSQSMNLFAQYYDNGESGKDEAYKVGGKFGRGRVALLWQYEFDEGLISLAEDLSALGSEDISTADGENRFEDNETTGADVWFLGVTFNLGKTMFIYEYGERKDSDKGRAKEDGHTGWLLGMKVPFDKYVYLYLGYLEKKFNDDRDKDTRYTIGATLTF